MNKNIVLCLLSFLPLASPAQKLIMSVGGASTLTVKTGTIFSADSLVFIPGTDFTFSSLNIQVSPVAVNIAPSPSINRVYYLSNQITFTGTMQLYYQLSELNGNTESSLLYTDTALGSAWLSQTGSTVNTAGHYVQYAVSARSFNGATASPITIILPITLVSFAGKWDNPAPALTWVVDQTDEELNFHIESCSDGVNWTTTGQVSGSKGNGTFTYTYNDNNASGHTMYYRIRLLEGSGLSTYSYVIKLTRGDYRNDLRLIVSGNQVSVLFADDQPSAVRLLSASGQVLRLDRTSRPEYDLSGLIPGVYFLQYEMNGQWLVRQFVVR